MPTSPGAVGKSRVSITRANHRHADSHWQVGLASDAVRRPPPLNAVCALFHRLPGPVPWKETAVAIPRPFFPALGSPSPPTMKKYSMYIDGKWVGGTRHSFVVSPASEET